MRRLIRFVAAAVAVGVSNAQGATVICNGTVDMLAYHQPGRLMLRLSSMNHPVFICSAESEWVVAGSVSGNTSPSTCKALYATFLAARVTGASLTGLYLDGDQVPAACDSFAPWTNVNVRYYQY